MDHEPSVGDVKSTRSRRAIDLDPVTVNVLRDDRGWHPDVITGVYVDG